MAAVQRLTAKGGLIIVVRFFGTCVHSISQNHSTSLAIIRGIHDTRRRNFFQQRSEISQSKMVMKVLVLRT